MFDFVTFSITLPYPTSLFWLIYFLGSVIYLLWHSASNLIVTTHRWLVNYWVNGSNWITGIFVVLAFVAWPVLVYAEWKIGRKFKGVN